MTLIAVLNKGWQAPKASNVHAKDVYRYNTSVARFCALAQMLHTRKVDIRAAHRRSLRKAGLPLTPVVNKYRAKRAY